MSMEDAGERLVERYGVAAVRDGKIEGFSSRAPDSLRMIILEAAKAAEAAPQVSIFAPPQLEENASISGTPAISYSNEDIILGGKEHEDLLRKTIQRCRHDLIIHSTFLLEDKFNAIKQQLIGAVQRGASIHVLWGKSDEQGNQSVNRPGIAGGHLV